MITWTLRENDVANNGESCLDASKAYHLCRLGAGASAPEPLRLRGPLTE